MRRLPPILLCLSALLLACPGSLENPERFLDGGGGGGGGDGGSSCGDVEADILKPKCGIAGCHAAMTKQSGLDLETMGIAARVVGKTTDPAGPCVGQSLPTVFDSKIKSTSSCGTTMRAFATTFNNADQACVHAWLREITDGGVP